MTTKALQPKNRISFFARITGATPEILERCSASCRRTFSLLGMAIIFTSVVGGLVVGYAVSVFTFKNMFMYPAIFLIWFIFTFRFDQTNTLSNNPASKWIRLGAILVLALFHAFVWDTITLKDDIKAQMQLEYNEKAAEVNNRFDKLVSGRQLHIDSLRNDNRQINQNRRGYIDSLQLEGRGLGGSQLRGIATIYRNLEKLKDEYNELAVEEIKSNNELIEAYRAEIEQINTNRAEEIQTIVLPEEFGMMEYFKKMHQMVFIQGSFTEQLFFAIWFLLFCFLESLPVVNKIVFRKQMQEYFFGVEAEQENSMKTFELRKSADLTVLQSEIQFDTQLRIAAVANDSSLKKIVMDKERIYNRLEILEEFLNELEQIDSELRSSFPSLYSSYVKNEIERSRDELLRSFKFQSFLP